MELKPICSRKTTDNLKACNEKKHLHENCMQHRGETNPGLHVV